MTDNWSTTPMIEVQDDDDDDIDDAIVLSSTGMIGPPVPTTVIVNGQVLRAPYPQRNDGVVVPRQRYDHVGALACINRDYLGPDPLMGSQFKLQFRMSRSMFEFILQETMNSGAVFYRLRDIDEASSVQAHLLLPIKTLAYGVPPHCFMDYFQMSKSQARKACSEFDKVMLDLFTRRFLHFPSGDDVRNIVDLHKAVHRVDGMFGSLDCTKTYWRQCPTQWQGAFQSGKDDKPSIVLEAVTDHHTYVWHFSYGAVGSMNDLNVLAASPLFEKFLDGTLERIERESGVVPFTVTHPSRGNILRKDESLTPNRVRDPSQRFTYEPQFTLNVSLLEEDSSLGRRGMGHILNRPSTTQLLTTHTEKNRLMKEFEKCTIEIPSNDKQRHSATTPKCCYLDHNHLLVVACCSFTFITFHSRLLLYNNSSNTTMMTMITKRPSKMPQDNSPSHTLVVGGGYNMKHLLTVTVTATAMAMILSLSTTNAVVDGATNNIINKNQLNDENKMATIGNKHQARVLGVGGYYGPDDGYYWPGSDADEDGRMDPTPFPTPVPTFVPTSQVPVPVPMPSIAPSSPMAETNGRVPPTVFRPPSDSGFIDGGSDISIGGGGNDGDDGNGNDDNADGNDTAPAPSETSSGSEPGQGVMSPTAFPTIEGEINVETPTNAGTNGDGEMIGPSMTTPNLPPAVIETIPVPAPTAVAPATVPVPTMMNGGDEGVPSTDPNVPTTTSNEQPSMPSSMIDRPIGAGNPPVDFTPSSPVTGGDGTTGGPGNINGGDSDVDTPGGNDGGSSSTDGSGSGSGADIPVLPPTIQGQLPPVQTPINNGTPGSVTPSDSNSDAPAFENSLTAEFCPGMVAEKASGVFWTYSIEYVPNTTPTEKDEARLGFESMLASRVLTCPSPETDVALGRGGRFLQSFDHVDGLVGVDSKPNDVVELTACPSNGTSVDDCRVYDGAMTIFLEQDANGENVRTEMLRRIRDVMGVDDFSQIPSILRVTYLAPILADDGVSEANGGSPSPETLSNRSQTQPFVVAFTTVGLFVFIAVSLVVYRLTGKKQQGDGTLTVAAASGMTTEISDSKQEPAEEDGEEEVVFSQSPSAFSAMLPSSYQMHDQDTMSAILEGDSSDESRTQSSVILSDGGYTTDGDSIQDESSNGNPQADPVLGVQKLDEDDFMANEREFLFETETLTDEEQSKMSPVSDAV